ncbi:MAG: nickel-binding protein [Cyanobacteria bacterium P01_D01_bin.115]
MSLVVVETLSEAPLYPEKPTESDFRTLDCIAERNGKWRYSLVSSDRHRMICTFEAPDTESIRESYRRGGTFFSRMWSGQVVIPASASSSQTKGTLTVVEYTLSKGCDWEESTDDVTSGLPLIHWSDAEWVCAYISRDRERVICEMTTPDVASIRVAPRQAHWLCDRVWSAIVVKP